jgi:hypothetical protein
MKKLFTTEQKKAEARACFAANDGVNEMHVTVDGMCFTNEGDANQHAQGICHDTDYKGHEKTDLNVVEVFKKDDVFKAVKVEKKVQPEEEEEE